MTAENNVDRLTRLTTAKTMTYADALFFLGYVDTDGSDVWTPQHWLAVDTMRVTNIQLERQVETLTTERTKLAADLARVETALAAANAEIERLKKQVSK